MAAALVIRAGTFSKLCLHLRVLYQHVTPPDVPAFTEASILAVLAYIVSRTYGSLVVSQNNVTTNLSAANPPTTAAPAICLAST